MRAKCPHCSDSKRALCETPEACARAERITANIRAKGSDAVSVRDAVHEACHAVMWRIKGSWSRTNIDRKNPWKGRKWASFGVRDEITARAVEALVMQKLGLPYHQDTWVMMMIMETLKLDGIALPGFDWAKEGIQLRMQSPEAIKLADDLIARFDVLPGNDKLKPCSKCGAEWTIFAGGDDAGLVHNPGCTKKSRKKKVV